MIFFFESVKDSTLKLEKLGIKNVRDLLFYKPSKIEKVFNTYKKDCYLMIEVEILRHLTNLSGKPPNKILCCNNNTLVEVVYFHKIPNFLIKTFEVGKKITLKGKPSLHDQRIIFHHPEIVFGRYSKNQVTYPLTYGVTNNFITSKILQILEKFPFVQEWISQTILDKYKFPSLYDALRTIHGIDANSTYENAIKRLAFDELLANQIVCNLIKKNRNTYAGNIFMVNHDLRQKILKKINIELTKSQEEVISKIDSYMLQNQQMRILLQGDVGSGKTMVALMTMINALNKQVVMMAPTEILANQHYYNISKILSDEIFMNKKIEVLLITGKSKPKNIPNENVIIIGTHAVFQEKITLENLGYVVIDEQHRFGVLQRYSLVSKGNMPDVLVMTATPIPRSLIMTIFGEMDILKLTDKPKGRIKIHTSVISFKKIPSLIKSLAAKIRNGDRIYWICPLISESEQKKKSNVEQRFEELVSVFPNEVSFIHGKMTPHQKDQNMMDFKNGVKKIIVATTVIEVGIDVPEASIIVIENAESFGLSQLHQLRGRVGRGTRPSYCILIYGSSISDNAKARLKIMKDSEDGFYISEEDLKLRGGGEIVGTKQSGDANFYFADMSCDADILETSSKYAELILEKIDPEKYENLHCLLKLFNYDNYIKYLS